MRKRSCRVLAAISLPAIFSRPARAFTGLSTSSTISLTPPSASYTLEGMGMLKKTRAKILGLYLVASIMITAIIQSVSSQPWEIDLLIGLSIFLVLGIYT